MKYLVLILGVSCLSACQKYSGEVQFKLPEVPYATSGEAAKKKEFTFPSVPYAQ
jgi:hypothetical protein